MSADRIRVSLAKNDRGVALVEFACVLPVLLLLYLGGAQLTDALACNRKVTIASRAVADLTTQNASVTDAQIQTILNAASKVIAPFTLSSATVQVSELYTDKNGSTRVVWSKNNKGSGYAANASYALPTNIKVNDSYVVVGQVVYSYQPAVPFKIIGPLTLADTIYMNPRVSNSVDYKTS